MMTTPIRPYLLSLMLVAAPVGLPAQAQDTAADPPVLPGDVVSIEGWREGDLQGEYIVGKHCRGTQQLSGGGGGRRETG